MDLEKLNEEYIQITGDTTKEGFQTYLLGWALSHVHSIDQPPDTDKHTTNTTPHTRYTFIQQLGKGAMGEVKLVKDAALRRPVAMKTMTAPTHSSVDWHRQFLSEVQITAQLDHPNIVPVYDFENSVEGNPSYTMKWIEGKTLRDVLRELAEDAQRGKPITGLYSLEHRLDIFLNACDAIAFAHSKGVLHRDLKPDNIMIGRYNQLYITDWGICTTFQDPSTVTGSVVEYTGTLTTNSSDVDSALGTPAYMSPEQAANAQDLDGRSDVYAMGLILFELISLRRAIPPGPVLVVLARAAKGIKQPLIHLDPNTTIPDVLHAIVQRATALHRRDRYDSIEHLADDVRRYLRREETHASPDTSFQRVGRWLSRHRQRALLASSALFILLTLSIVGLLALNIYTHQQNAQRQKLHTTLQAALTQQSDTIDHTIYRLHNLLTSITSRAGETIHTPLPTTPARLYTSKDFDQSLPPDLAHSKHYNAPTSYTHPVLVIAPNIPQHDAQKRALHMHSVTPVMRNAFVLAAGKNPQDTNDTKMRSLILDDGSLIFSIFLHMDGVHLEYPGRGGYPKHYDGRLRPWYTVAYNTDEVRCSTPYRGALLGSLVLPCCTSIFDTSHTFQGIGCLELQFDWLQEHTLSIPDDALPKSLRSALVKVALVNQQGQVLIDRNLSKNAEKIDALLDHERTSNAFEFSHDTSMKTPLLPWLSVLEAVRRGEQGVQHVRDASGSWLVAYTPLLSIDASYLVIVDHEKYTKRPK